MTEAITSLCLSLLRFVAQHPDSPRDGLLALKGVQGADLAYLVQHDLIREREPGCFRISHLGQRVLDRGL